MFDEIETPALILDQRKLHANVTRMLAKADAAGIALRPHLKTAKSIDVADRATDGRRFGITVSTLREADYFADHGYRDITYGVGIAPGKLDHAQRLVGRGVDLKLILDTTEAADAVATHGAEFQVMIEIDCGDNRAGIVPEDPTLLEIAKRLADAPNATLRGILTHAGHSYGADSIETIKQIAEEERRAAVTAADILRTNGYAIDMVSAGSTPTALYGENVDGLTELRAGVYVFFDLDQQSRGVCSRDDIALGVLATVIGHNKAAGKVLLDSGGLALSKDIGANKFRPEVGYGEICDPETGAVIPDLYVTSVSQEHGHVRVSSEADFQTLPIGKKVKVLPNHACMTAAAYDAYNVIDSDGVVARWPRINGW